MKKLLTLLLILLSTIVYGQHTLIFGPTGTYTSTIVDSTRHDIDTIFTVKNNIVYRTIETTFQEDSKEWRLIKYTTTFDGNRWNWDSMSIEKYYPFYINTSNNIGIGTLEFYNKNYRLIGTGDVLPAEKPKKKKK